MMLFRPSQDASQRDVRLAGAKGIVVGIVIASAGSLAMGAMSLRTRAGIGSVFIPWLIFGVMLIIFGCYRAIFGLDSNTGRAGWLRVLLIICVSSGVAALVALAAIPIGQWLDLW